MNAVISKRFALVVPVAAALPLGAIPAQAAVRWTAPLLPRG